MRQEPNSVDIVIYYSTKDNPKFTRTYTAEYNPDTGIQQYLDYYEQGFLHDYPEAVRMEIVRIESYHRDSPERRDAVYESEGKYHWS